MTDVPRRPCQANIALVPELRRCAEDGIHVITGPDGRLQWFGCEEHAREAREELGCTIELFERWYKRLILGEPMGMMDFLKGPK